MKQDYIYLDFEENLDAYYYHQICPSVTITDDKTRKFLMEKRNFEAYFFDKYDTFITKFPHGTTGKFHQSNRKIIDWWEVINPGCTPTVIAVISQRFVDVLNSVGVNTREYYIRDINVLNNKSDIRYYLLFVPMILDNSIVFNESTFTRIIGDGPETMVFGSIEELLDKGSCYGNKDVTIAIDNNPPDMIMSQKVCPDR